MATKSNMTLIETKTVSAGGAANINFTVPGTYTDLYIVCSLRGNRPDTNTEVIVRFNGSTTGFTNKVLYGSGSGVGTGSNTNFDILAGGQSNTANTFGNATIYIPNYAGNTYKSFTIDSVNESNATNSYQITTAGLWSNTAAITSVQIAPNGINGTSFDQYSSASLYGVKRDSIAPKATGGLIYQANGYVYHAFLASGTFTPTAGTLSCDVLMVAGGGGSYDNTATGGGGAGGVVYTSGTSVSSALTIAVGAGGYSGGGDPGALSSGGNTTVTGLTTAIGGGKGGTTQYAAASGGSGGGGVGSNFANQGTAGAAGTAGQGFAGAGGIQTGSPAFAGGGGGGSGAAGAQGIDQGAYSSTGGAGGIGLSTYSTFGLATGTGEVVGGAAYYAGGGGGNGSNARGAGGYGGGGGNTRAVGLPATGGGGAPSGNGGSGIVIVRYAA